MPDKVADVDAKRQWAKTRISELRKALGAGDTLAGRHWLPTTATTGNDRYRLVEIHVDMHHFIRHIDAARETDGAEAIEELSHAMSLIAGEVGAGELNTRAWTTRTIHHLQALIVCTAAELARRALDAGDAWLADWTASQARLAVPYDQALIPHAVRAKVILGDRLGLRRLREEVLDLHGDDLRSDVMEALDTALCPG